MDGARKLKVFLARIGFYDSVVAAPSQAAALRAWGVHQNLFADGQAKIAQDADAVAAALAHPETPLRRAIGSTEPFGLDGGAAKIDLPRKAKAAKGRQNAPAKPIKPPPDRSKLDAAEAALAKVGRDRKGALDRLRRQREALDAEEAEARQSWDQRHAEAQASVDRERGAYRDQ